MKTLKNKLKKQGGFTLVEMLTVVAIIAILIAISIPMVTGALDRAKKATDAANIRAAKACASIKALTETNAFVDATSNKTIALAYDAQAGNLADTATKYRKFIPTGEDANTIIYVTVVKDVVYYQWGAPGTKPDAPTVDASGTVTPGNWKTAVEPNDF